jgi:hypothetical protein
MTSLQRVALGLLLLTAFAYAAPAAPAALAARDFLSGFRKATEAVKTFAGAVLKQRGLERLRKEAKAITDELELRMIVKELEHEIQEKRVASPKQEDGMKKRGDETQMLPCDDPIEAENNDC